LPRPAPAKYAIAETAALLERGAGRLQQRIDCLSRNRDAVRGYLATVTGTAAPGTISEEGSGQPRR
jgi:hypothetical protein